MMDDNDTVVPTSNISASNTAPAMVHAEQSSRGALKYRGTNGSNFIALTDSDEIIIDEASPPIESRYGDFHTIDWQRDLARDRLRHKFIVKRNYDNCLTYRPCYIWLHQDSLYCQRVSVTWQVVVVSYFTLRFPGEMGRRIKF
ncbi:hypothetical protein WUBG_14285 [Wuchereria bancrofti]|uniref:Uncharacterized protein n=1 Tax=Wuchereria bancrofti TaxID=6293 RepID=J9DYI7_WUCBA|nr:hypothetical protein WUBG_14285 [Wuchereria bancrofti]